VAPGSATVDAGQTATYKVTVGAQGGAFAGAVTLGCSNLPPGATCTFNPSTVAPGAASAQSTLTISTTARGAAMLDLTSAFNRTTPVIVSIILMLLWCYLPRPRRAFAAVPVVLLAALVACGGNNTPPPVNNRPGTPGATTATVSPSSLTFNSQTTQTTSAPQTVTLTNSGNASLTISGVTASGDFTQTNTCGTSVAAGANCMIAVTFTPTAAGQRNGTLSIADNATGSPQTVGLSGTGVSATAGTPAGSYQVSVTGAAGTLTQAGTVTLVVR